MDVVEPLIVDLCTGSGAIALALAQEVPRSRVHAVELSEDALAWTRKNVEGSRVDLRQGRRPGRLPRPRRPGRPGHLQPAVHPAHRVGVRRSRGPRPRSRDSPCSRARTASTSSAASNAPHTGCCGPAASSSSSTRTPRAARCRGSSPRNGAGPTRPTTPTSTTARASRPPAGPRREHRHRTTTLPHRPVRVRGGPLDGTAIRHQRRDRPHDRSARGRVRRPPRRAGGAARPTPSTASVPTRSPPRPSTTCWRPRAAAVTCPRPS